MTPASPDPVFRALAARLFIVLESPRLARARFELSLARVRPQGQEPLELEGSGLCGSTEGAWLNGRALDWRSALSPDGLRLIIEEAPDEALFCCEMRHELPGPGSPLGGLWSHGGRVGAQCDPAGFHAIAWAPARLAQDPEWSCEIEADAALFPSLRALGILVDCQIAHGRQRVCYREPSPTPLRLFTLLAGPLDD